jgi:hypothetical protein
MRRGEALTTDHATADETPAAPETPALNVTALPGRAGGERIELAYDPGTGRFYAQVWSGEDMLSQIGPGRAYLTPDALYAELCRQLERRGLPVPLVGEELMINSVLWVLTKGAEVPKPNAEPAAPVYSREEVSEALNEAADFVQDRTQGDEVIRDATNLIVNLGLGFLDDPTKDPLKIIEEMYAEDDPETVLGWLDQ